MGAANTFYSNQSHIGTATLEFVFNSPKPSGRNNLLAVPFLREIKHWFEKGASNNLDEVKDECSRLSEKAMAYFIMQAVKVSASVWAELLLSPQYGGNLNTVLTCLKFLDPTKSTVARVVCAMLEINQATSISLEDAFLDSLVGSIKEVSGRHFSLMTSTNAISPTKRSLGRLKRYFSDLSRSKVQEHLPIESSTLLVDLYLAEYSDKAVGYLVTDQLDVRSHLLG